MTENTVPAPQNSGAGEVASDDPGDYLAATWFLDFDVAEVAAYADEQTNGTDDPVEKAVKLYYAVRDGFRYDPYAMDMRRETFKASWVLENARGFCVQKGNLLAALARHVGIPARLGYADVRNHLATQRLLDILGTDLFIYHGFVELHVGGRWVKCTPAFNIELCDKFDVLPLEFDGREDSLFHPFDASGRRHMEYVNQRGVFADLPYEQMAADFEALYPKYFALHGPGGDFHAEAEAEHKPGS